MRTFYEQPPKEKEIWYGRDATYETKVFTNSWDTMFLQRQLVRFETTSRSSCFYSLGTFLRYQVDEWGIEMTRLSFRIADLLAKGLDRKDRPFRWMLGRLGLFANFYPRCRDPDRRIVGFQPHTDPCLFSILLQDDLDGLKGLYNKNGYEIRTVR